jgi:predicted ATPase
MQALNNIGFSNFKAFRDYQSAELSPISLFFGYNNSGKSSILRAVKLLSDSFKVNDTKQYMESILDYTSQSIRGASHQELTHIKSSGIQFSLGWGDGSSLKFKVKQNGLDPEIIEEIQVTLLGTVYHFLPSLKEGASSDTFELKGSSNEVELTIINLRLSCKEIDFSSINHSLNVFSDSVFHLNSTRAFPPREFEIGVGIPLGISPDGIGTAESIWYLSEANSPSFTDINDWLESISGRVISTDGAPISIKNGKRTVRLETISASKNMPTSELSSVSVLDSGEGIAQVLPVITLCAQAANNELGDFPIIVLEQPELHLHPDATVALAEFICGCAQKNKNARFIIETHSESFLLSIQKALVSKKLSKEDFSCNWVSKESSSSKISRVIFDDDGYIVENWPDDVFGEIFQQTRDLIDARERNAVESS